MAVREGRAGAGGTTEPGSGAQDKGAHLSPGGDKCGTVGHSAWPPPPQGQRLLPLEPPGTICGTVCAQPSLGKAPQAALGGPAGRQALASENPHRENTLCLPPCHLLEGPSDGERPASVTLRLQLKGDAPGSRATEDFSLEVTLFPYLFPLLRGSGWQFTSYWRDRRAGSGYVHLLRAPSSRLPVWLILALYSKASCLVTAVHPASLKSSLRLSLGPRVRESVLLGSLESQRSGLARAWNSPAPWRCNWLEGEAGGPSLRSWPVPSLVF